MANGVISLSKTGSGKIYGQIVWSATSNGTEANNSTVTASVQIKRQSGYTTTGTWNGSLKIGNTTKSISWYGSISSNWVTVGTLTETIAHADNGSGSCYIYSKISGPSGTSQEGTYVSGSETVALDAIPRQAILTSATNFNDEQNPTITYSNPLGAAVPSLQAGISLTQHSADVIAYHDVSKTGITDIIELSESERNTLRAAVTDGNTRTVWIYLRTRIGETYYYSPLSRTLTIKDPKPIINPTVKDSNAATIALTGNSNKLIKYYSNASITIGASAVKKATLTETEVTCGSKTLNSDGTINGIETGEFVFTATDSRGNITVKTLSIPTVDYVKLTCNLSNNIPDADGDMTVMVTGNYFNGSFGTKNNSLNVYYRYKPVGGTYGEWTAMSITKKNNNSYTAEANVYDLDYQMAYTFEAYAKDELDTANAPEKTVKSTPVFDWGENDFKFNVPVYLQNGVLVKDKRCVVGNNSSSDTNPWYKFASITATNLNEDMRISFKVTYSYGSNTRFATLNVFIRTENASGANSVQRIEFESDSGIDASNFVLVHNGTGVNSIYELWVKLTAYRFCMFEVLSESSRTAFIDKWVLYNQISNGYAANSTSGYTKVAATKPYLLNTWPIGSYYMANNNTSPATLFGGTWERIEGRFLYGCAATGTVGATGSHTTGSGSSSLPYVNVAIWRRIA